MRRQYRWAAAAILLTWPGAVLALGTASYSSELISPRSMGQGGTGVAGTQNDPVAAYTNPAAMTSMKGTQISVAGSYINARPEFTNAANSGGFGSGSPYTRGTAGEVTGARATSVAIPAFAATTQFLDGKLAAGLAAVMPYGLETHFDGDSPVRYAATDARLRIVDVTPSAAYAVNEAFSIGAGFDYWNVVDASLEKKINVNAVNAGLGGTGGPDANSRLSGTGDGWGYHVGLTFKPAEKQQIGVVYHSSVKVELTGDVQLTGLSGNSAAVFGGHDFSTGATAPLYMPQNVQVGYSFTPDERWNFEADAAWYDWYAARQIGIVANANGAAVPATANRLLQAGNPQVFNPRKTINFGIGANYKHSEELQLRGGFYYQAAALPESSFDPAFVDLPRYALTAGLGYALSKNLALDAAYNAVFFHSRSINAPDGTGGSSGYTGSFSSFANIVSASLTYRLDARL